MQPQICFLNPEEQEQIHNSAVWLLSNIGFQMPSRQAVSIMRQAGATVENENIVKISANMIAEAVAKALKRDQFVLYGREQKYDVHFGKDTPVLCSMRNATHVIDVKTDQIFF